MKKKEKEKVLGKPKVNIKELSGKKVISKFPYHPMVREGRIGYFSDEYENEVKWLS